MSFKELKVGMGKVFLQCTIHSLGNIKELNTGQKVQTATIIDKEGNLARLDLWNEHAGAFKERDDISLENVYVKSLYEGQLNITPGKYGKVTVVLSAEQKDQI